MTAPAPGPLEGRSAVITGGGRGIGRAVAERLSDAGAAVVVAARSAAEVEQAVEELRARGRRAVAVRCDVTDPASVEALATAAAREVGEVDILVNNAGTSSSAPLRRLALEEWNRLLAVNATGTFLCTRAFLPGMMERGWGRIVNVASVAGLKGGAYIAGYCAAKHAVVGLTRSVALEAARSGVTVNAVCPGYVDTPMTRESVSRIVETTGRSEEEARAAILAASPQRRLVTPSEVAHAVLSLCHEEARGVNGSTVVIDGGETAG
jgi:3-hydroxybutyrate dehydrogenase